MADKPPARDQPSTAEAVPPDSPVRRQLGQLRGTITIADDFDDTPTEVLDALAEPL